ncbi:MAG: NlpC/P60 family protein [Pseudomonadota bacterium]
MRRLKRVGAVALVIGVSACGAMRWEEGPVDRSSPTVSAPPQQAPRAPVESSNSSKTVSALLNDYYTDWRGTPYRFGGVSRDGIDCSAFTQQALRNTLGVRLPRTTSLQLRAGRSILRNQVQAGDLVFFKTGETLNHVGIMLGGAKFMHASTSRGVTISRLDDRYWSARVIGYRRVTGE